MRTAYSSHPRQQAVVAWHLACITCLFSPCLPLLRAGDPDPATVAAVARCRADLSADDCRLTVAALKSLAADPRLAHLNLGVTVHDHVIALWGFVPSAQIGKLAESRLLDVPGVGRVLNQLQLSPGQEDTQPGDTIIAPRAVPSGLPAPDGPLPSDVPAPLRVIRPSPAVADHGIEANGSRPTRVAARALCATMEPPLAEPPHPPSIASPAQRAIANMIRGDVRYLHLRAEIRGEAVSLQGQVYSWNDLQLLAGAVARLPGVQRVLLDHVHVGR